VAMGKKHACSATISAPFAGSNNGERAFDCVWSLDIASEEGVTSEAVLGRGSLSPAPQLCASALLRYQRGL
jgi:hypothetical protein